MSGVMMIAAMSALCVNIPVPGPGTNGAGEERNWTAVDGRWTGSVRAGFFAVYNGDVRLSVPQRFDLTVPVSWQKPNREKYRLTGTSTIPVCVPLAVLSAGDRRWIEERNPTETCLDGRARRGVVGTLSPTRGWYCVQQITGDKALIDYIVDDQVVWTFWLRSSLVSVLKVAQRYEAISTDLVPEFRNLPPMTRERYGVDFRIINRQTKDRKLISLVEDYR